MDDGDAAAPSRVGPKPKWLEPNYDRARRSNANERRLAARLGGLRIPRSGGRLWSPREARSGTGITEGGDVKTTDFHLENKRTERQSLSVKRAWLDNIRQAARRVGKDPGVILTFETRGPKESMDDWVLIPMIVFERLRSVRS